MQHLARKGAKVYIAGRSEARVKAAIERLRAEGLEPGNGAIEWLQLDLGDPRKVKESAEKFAEKETRLDVLGGDCELSVTELLCADIRWKFIMPACKQEPILLTFIELKRLTNVAQHGRQVCAQQRRWVTSQHHLPIHA